MSMLNYTEIVENAALCSERSEKCLVTECILTCSWRFLRLDKLEQLKFKLEKLLEFRIQVKLEKEYDSKNSL